MHRSKSANCLGSPSPVRVQLVVSLRSEKKLSLSGLRSTKIIQKGRNTASTCCSNTGPHVNGHSRFLHRWFPTWIACDTATIACRASAHARLQCTKVSEPQIASVPLFRLCTHAR